jgi:hypothetical protein
VNAGASHFVTTSSFAVEPGEDAETNPGIYGRAFAHWLTDRLRERGEPVEAIIAEDFGWCVMLRRTPYRLWIACGNRDGSTTEWGPYVVAEPSVVARLFRRVDPGPEIARLTTLLEQIMLSIPGATNHTVE